MAAEQGADRKEPAIDVPKPGVVRTIMAVLGGLVPFLLILGLCGIVLAGPKPPSGTIAKLAGAIVAFLAACAAGYCMGHIAGRKSWLPVSVFTVLLLLAYGALLVYVKVLSGFVFPTVTAGLAAGVVIIGVVALCWARIGEAVARGGLRPHGKKLARIAAVSVCAFLVISALGGVGLYLLSGPSGEMKELDRRLNELKASGAPMSLAEAAPPPVPDEENGALLYMEAFEQLAELSLWKEQYERQFAQGELFGSEAPFDEVVRFFEDSRAVYDLLRAAAQRPRCRFPLDYDAGMLVSQEHHSDLRECVRYLSARAQTMARAGRMEEAVQTTLASFGPGRSIRNEPMMFYAWLFAGGLHRKALAALREIASTGRLEADQINQLAKSARWPDAREALTNAYTGERARGIRLFDQVRSGNTIELVAWLEGELPAQLDRVYGTPLGARILARDELFYLDAMEHIIATAPLPYAEATERVREWRAEIRPPKLGLVGGVILPDQLEVAKCGRVVQADEAVTLTGLRLLAHRDETGRYPPDLAELERADGQPLPLDPFTGAPLHYQPREDGFLLYSYGPDEEDDAGEDDDVAWEMVGR